MVRPQQCSGCARRWNSDARARTARERLLLLLLLLLMGGAAAEVPLCHKFAAYLQCGPPVEEFRNAEMDLTCQEFVVGAGYCVCADAGCTDEANHIRVEIDCAPPDLVEQATTTGIDSRNCTSICASSSRRCAAMRSAASRSFSTPAMRSLLAASTAVNWVHSPFQSKRDFMVWVFISAN